MQNEVQVADLNDLQINHQKDRLPNTQRLVSDPYGYFYEEEILEENPEENLDDVIVDFNAKNFKKHLTTISKEYKKSRKKYITQGMEYDPAFMMNPVEDYYSKQIPAEISESLSEDEHNEVMGIFDPVTWGEKNLLLKHGGWKARNSKDGLPYQSQLIRCKSKRVVVRAGRRIGKTAALVVRLLHKAFTYDSQRAGKPTFNIVIFTPNQSQIRLIFKMMEVFIDGNPKLLAMIGDGPRRGLIPTRQQPHWMLELNNGVNMYGFVSGSSAVRGSAADVLVLDEASFLTSDDTDAVLALINEHKDVELFISSTPKGLKDYFYDRVHDPSFVNFYFPSDKFHPYWSRRMEEEFQAQLTSSGYRHEVLADFSADGEGVFQIPFVESAFNNECTIAANKREANCVYGMGVDWNDSENGTKIIVVEYNIEKQRYRIVDHESVNIEKWTQTTAVQKVMLMNRKWECSFIYVDHGHGGTQVELLHAKGAKAAPKTIDKRLLKVKGIKFKSIIEIIDPWMHKKVRKETKPFMVNNAVRIFEEYRIDIPVDIPTLQKQLEGYVVERITPSGVPVYGKDKKVGDHVLDALLLALFGFTMEHSEIGKPRHSTAIASTDRKLIGGGKQVSQQNTEGQLDKALQDQTSADRRLMADKAREAKELENANGRTMLLNDASKQAINNSTSILVSEYSGESNNPVTSFKRKGPKGNRNKTFRISKSNHIRTHF